MKVAVDTNVLVYAEGLGDLSRQERAAVAIEQLGPARLVIPGQVLGELLRVLVAKSRMPRLEAFARVGAWRDTCVVAGTSVAAFDAAFDLAQRHGLQIWDAVILSAAAEAGCSLLLSEDMQEGFVWGGLTIVNPLADVIHPLLRRALEPD